MPPLIISFHSNIALKAAFRRIVDRKNNKASHIPLQPEGYMECAWPGVNRWCGIMLSSFVFSAALLMHRSSGLFA
jgi:hypothetical protein